MNMVCLKTKRGRGRKRTQYVNQLHIELRDAFDRLNISCHIQYEYATSSHAAFS